MSVQELLRIVVCGVSASRLPAVCAGEGRRARVPAVLPRALLLDAARPRATARGGGRAARRARARPPVLGARSRARHVRRERGALRESAPTRPRQRARARRRAPRDPRRAARHDHQLLLLHLHLHLYRQPRHGRLRALRRALALRVPRASHARARHHLRHRRRAARRVRVRPANLLYCFMKTALTAHFIFIIALLLVFVFILIYPYPYT